MMQFPITELLDEEECYHYLQRTLHPDGLGCPSGHRRAKGQAPHERKRPPVAKYRCRQCGKVFDIFTGTVWCGTHYDCKTIVLLLRGFVQGIPSFHLAHELGLDYETVLNYRHAVQAQALQKKDRSADRSRDRVGRDVSKRGRKGHAPRRPRRPAAAAGE